MPKITDSEQIKKKNKIQQKIHQTLVNMETQYYYIYMHRYERGDRKQEFVKYSIYA